MIRQLAASLALAATLGVSPARADLKADYLELVERGWNYAFRGSARGHADDLSPGYVLAGAMAPRAICLIGEAPHPVMAETLAQFRHLLRRIFGTAGPVFPGRRTIGDCEAGETIFIRFYSRPVPNELFNADIDALNDRFDLGLSGRQRLNILSPAQAVTMFGRAGQITHLSLLEPVFLRISELERDFYRSMLIEELYQSYSFGIDVFKTEHDGPLLSKLQETPVNLRLLEWTSAEYMAGLLQSNPRGLCHFDAMMLHALAAYPGNSAANIPLAVFVERDFDALYEDARATAARAEFSELFDPDCRTAPPR